VSSIEEVDALLGGTGPISESTAAPTLRRWRTQLVRASVFVSYAIGVLSLDAEILTRGTMSASDDIVAETVDDLPEILAAGWVGGGWSLSPDAAASVAAAADVGLDRSEGLLRLHGEVAAADLNDPDVVRDLLDDVVQLRDELIERKNQLELRIKVIQETVRRQYKSGAASIDDWLA